MNEAPSDDKEFVVWAAQRLGLSVDALGARIGKKSLKRVKWGSLELHPAQRQHIEDLLTIKELQDKGTSRHFLTSDCDAVGSRPSGRVRETPQSAREPQSMGPPPHVPLRLNSPDKIRSEQSPHENYAEAVAILNHLLENHPEALSSLMFSLRAIYQTHPEKE